MGTTLSPPALRWQPPAKLDVSVAEEVRAQLLELLDGQGSILVDAREVVAVDTACLQILCAFAREVQRAGRSITWGEASPALSETARRSGLSEALVLE